MTLYINGKFFTADDEQLYATAMLVENRKVIWIGETKGAPAYDGKKVDLCGKRVLPGIIDAHIHPLYSAIILDHVACTPPSVMSIQDMLHALKQKGKTANGWIEGFGYDEGKLAEGRTPTREDLDQVSTKVPIMVKRTCFHIISVNSKALEIAGITKDTPDPEGGQIDRNQFGEPTGILREQARFLVEKHIQFPKRESYINLLVQYSQKLSSYGITGVTEMYAESEPFDYLSLYRDAYKAGYKQKTALYYPLSELQEKDLLTEDNISVNEPIFIAGVKLLADGSVSGRTAWIEKPFEGEPDNYGLSTTTEATLQKAINLAREKGVQVAVHAMGEQAIDQVVTAFAAEKPWLKDGPTYRVEHAALPTEEAMTEAGKKEIAFIPQTIFQYAEIESYIANLGEQRTKNAFPIPAFLANNIPTALSSDAPATAWSEPADPFVTIKAAVTRKAYDGQDIGQQHAIDVETAIKLYTQGSQLVTRIPNVGQLKAGYWADFIVLSEDLFTVEPEEITNVEVEQTFIGGKLVFERSKVKV